MTNAAHQGTVVGLGVAMLADAPVLHDVGTIVLIFRDDVHDTSDSVGTIDRATAILQNFDPINGS